jgi:DNA-binding NarL/FixJ family response regulator
VTQDGYGGGTATLPRPAGQASGPPARQPGQAKLVQVVLADEAPLMHLAIRSVLATVPGFVLTASACCRAEAEQFVLRVAPDLLITDIDLAGESGVSLCRWTRQVSPRTAVVILASRDEPILVQSALQAGAAGYLLKASPPDMLIGYLRQVADGLRVLDERLGRSRPAWPGRDVITDAGLSPREREVLDEVLSGLGNRAIAQRLCISEDTVKSHVKAIFRKLGARDRAHAVALAVGTATMAELVRDQGQGLRADPAGAPVPIQRRVAQ